MRFKRLATAVLEYCFLSSFSFDPDWWFRDKCMGEINLGFPLKFTCICPNLFLWSWLRLRQFTVILQELDLHTYAPVKCKLGWESIFSALFFTLSSLTAFWPSYQSIFLIIESLTLSRTWITRGWISASGIKSCSVNFSELEQKNSCCSKTWNCFVHHCYFYVSFIKNRSYVIYYYLLESVHP